MSEATTKREEAVHACGPGRPLCPELHKAVIKATIRLLDTHALGDLTINGISKEASVSRPAIYRRWSNVREIALEAFMVSTDQQIPETNDLTADEALRTQILFIVRFLRGRGGRFVADLIGEGQSDPQALADFRERFLEKRRSACGSVVDRGIASGTFAPEVDVDLAIDLFVGPIYYRLLTGHGELSDTFADELADRVLRALAL